MTVTGNFSARGGISTQVTAKFEEKKMICIRNTATGTTRILFVCICMLIAVFFISGCSPLQRSRKPPAKFPVISLDQAAGRKRPWPWWPLGTKRRCPQPVFQKAFHRNLTAKLLSACSEAIFIKPDDKDLSRAFGESPKTGNRRAR